MESPAIEAYLREVIRYVRFFPDRRRIYEELLEQVLELREQVEECELTEEEKDAYCINALGDAKVLGKRLNKEHNAWIGWLFYITQPLKWIVVAAFLYLSTSLVIMDISNFINYHDPVMEEQQTLFVMDMQEEFEVDDVTFNFYRLICDKNKAIHIFYKSTLWSTRLRGTLDIGSISVKDNKGKQYDFGTSETGGLIWSYGDFSFNIQDDEATNFYIDYNRYGRSFHFEIELPENWSEGGNAA